VELPPLRIEIPREQYIVETRRADRRAIRQALMAPPVEQVERVYALEEVRASERLRDKLRRVDLDTITFEFGSAAISPSQFDALTEIGEVLESILDENPDELFLIEGHTDAVGSDYANLLLSDRRAEAVAVMLSSNFDIPPENLITQGYGEQFLKSTRRHPERENRRVAIRRITELVRAGREAGTPNKWNDAYSVLCDALNEMNDQGRLAAWADAGDVDGFIRHLTYRVHNHGAGRGAIWGDKYPEYLLALPQLGSIFPGARWIFVIRDPVSTVHSLLTTRRGQMRAQPVVQELRRNIDDAVQQWEQWNWNWQQFRASLPVDSYLEVNFSELLKDPHAAVEPIASFLNVDLAAPAARTHMDQLNVGVADRAQDSSTHRAMMQMTPSPRFVRLVREYGFDTFRALQLNKPPEVPTVPLSSATGSAPLTRSGQAPPPRESGTYMLVEPKLTGPSANSDLPVLSLPKSQSLRHLRYFQMRRVCFLPSGALQTPAGPLIREAVPANYRPRQHRAAKTAAPCSAPVLLPARVGYTRYFHWLTEVLPAVMLQDFTDTVVVGAAAPRFVDDTIQLANTLLGTRKIVQRHNLPAWFEHAILPEQAIKYGSGHSRLSSAMVECFSRLRNALPPVEHPTRRIFISREDSKFRKVENERLIAEMFANQGYEVLVLSEMSLAEQWRAFKEADEVVGFHGAGLANAIFLSQGRKLTEIMPHDHIYRIRVYWDIASVRKLDYRLHVIPPIDELSGVSLHDLADLLTGDPSARQTIALKTS
jgi:outer membrane protein OmpA-like peptidoglycan-associated protein/capsular polysaccharide biosynthesis protein